MAKILFLTKLLFKKQAVSRQAAKWTPIIMQRQLQNDAFKGYFFGLLGIPSYFQTKSYKYLEQLKHKSQYQFLSEESTSGLSGLSNESTFTPQNGRQGDFKQIKGNQFVHAVSVVQNPFQMDEFSLDDVQSVVSDFEYEEEFNNSQFSESLILSWNNSSSMDSLSTINSNNQ